MTIPIGVQIEEFNDLYMISMNVIWSEFDRQILTERIVFYFDRVSKNNGRKILFESPSRDVRALADQHSMPSSSRQAFKMHGEGSELISICELMIIT